jgi:hypothetical protein
MEIELGPTPDKKLLEAALPMMIDYLGGGHRRDSRKEWFAEMVDELSDTGIMQRSITPSEGVVSGREIGIKMYLVVEGYDIEKE